MLRCEVWLKLGAIQRAHAVTTVASAWCAYPYLLYVYLGIMASFFKCPGGGLPNALSVCQLCYNGHPRDRLCAWIQTCTALPDLIHRSRCLLIALCDHSLRSLYRALKSWPPNAWLSSWAGRSVTSLIWHMGFGRRKYLVRFARAAVFKTLPIADVVAHGARDLFFIVTG